MSWVTRSPSWHRDMTTIKVAISVESALLTFKSRKTLKAQSTFTTSLTTSTKTTDAMWSQETTTNLQACTRQLISSQAATQSNKFETYGNTNKRAWMERCGQLKLSLTSLRFHADLLPRVSSTTPLSSKKLETLSPLILKTITLLGLPTFNTSLATFKVRFQEAQK